MGLLHCTKPYYQVLLWDEGLISVVCLSLAGNSNRPQTQQEAPIAPRCEGATLWRRTRCSPSWCW